MTVVLSWVVAPAVLVLACVGCGLLVEAAAGFRLPGALVPPVGLALVVVASDLTTMHDRTAELTTPVVVVLAVAGFGLSFPWRGRAIDVWACVAALAVFGVYALPILATGTATFAGYLTLDDTATWLGLSDHALQYGRSFSMLEPSTYQQVVADYMTAGYPLGAFTILGIGSQLTGQDVAWLFQPAIALFAAMLALAIYVACRARRRVAAVARARRRDRGAAGSPLRVRVLERHQGVGRSGDGRTPLRSARLDEDRWTSARGALPVAVAVAALFAILSPAGGIWLVVPAVVVVVALAWRGLGHLARGASVLVVLVALLSIPSIAIARSFLAGASGAEITESTEVARLGHPLSLLQSAGIWPATDFRTPLHDSVATYVLIAVLLGCGVFALVVAFRIRAWALPLFVATAVGGVLVALRPRADRAELTVAEREGDGGGLAGDRRGWRGRRVGAVREGPARGGSDRVRCDRRGRPVVERARVLERVARAALPARRARVDR